jgi:periplasmic divalent cation tolerance protein
MKYRIIKMTENNGLKIHWIYMTAKNMEEAVKVGNALLKEKLAACINIIDNMKSMYVWEGEIQNEQEVVVIAKTTEEKIPALIEKVKTLHSYECPCIIALPVESGYLPFMKWVEQEVTP